MNFLGHISENIPLFELLISIVLILGLHNLGSMIFKVQNFRYLIETISDIKYQQVLISTNLILIFLFPITLFFKTSNIIIFILSSGLIFLGLIQIKIFFFNQIFETKFQIKFSYDLIISIFLVVFFLISIAPVTHSDSLDYHIQASKFIAKNGYFPKELDNYHFFLLGAGESLMSLGYIFNSQQFGNIIQFSGLVSLIGILKKNKVNSLFYSLILLSTPVIIFLASSPKPQLFSIASNVLLVALLYRHRNILLKKEELNYLLILILTILINSTNIKFSFILSSFIIFIFSFYIVYKNNYFKNYLLLSIIFFILFYLPFLHWKSTTWGGDFYDYLINPFPVDFYGIENFRDYLNNYNKNSNFLYLVFPKSIGKFTESIGLIFFLLIFLRQFNKNLIFLILFTFLFYVIITTSFGQLSGRFLIEPFIWLLIIFSIEKISINKPFKILTIIQSFFVFIFLLYGVYTLTPGVLSKGLYENVMNNTANGYSLMSWAEKKIIKGDKYIFLQRSSGMSENSISTTFTYYIDKHSSEQISYFLKIIAKQNPKYLVSKEDVKNNLIFKDCIEKLFFFEKNIGRYAARNPMNVGKKYDGYIYKLKEPLGICIAK